jgi:adenylate kinase
MEQLTFMFYGCSGSGKGTQAALLMEYLKKEDPKGKILYIQTGQKFRDFAKLDYYTSRRTADVINSGHLMPAFLPIWIWTDFLIKNLDENDHIIFDGLVRRADEAPIFDGAMKFYARKKPYIILLNVSEKWATERLLERRRSDDKTEEIKKRIDWYRTDVVPTLDFFKNNDYYTFLEINGEQTIEQVHEEIIKKIDDKNKERN